ncbi:hypothetical protein HSX37_16090|uniref:Uncharacterized protein n=1 Tax=Dendrosporobacter quercicolus TaxID=146817 RepID=A0A1G9ZMN0_9FIRM|nr:hypothetical protein [Dendrosporobacter quercicolus]NSL49556.1 hypothetical protein [Dendrosporobacter quercicolus DSM 1736]SDN22598.1 hypothetical protein SAMN04488502_11511 [Dendrosporobacter quercicolus]
MAEITRIYRNWDATGSAGYSTAATSYGAFTNLPLFEESMKTIRAAGFKFPTSSNVSSANLIIYSSPDLRIHYVSPPISVVTDPGGFKLIEIDNLAVRIPYHFGIGLRALAGTTLTAFNSGFDFSGVELTQVYNGFNGVGSVLIPFGGRSTTLSWGSYVDVNEYEIINFTGVELDLVDSAQRSSASRGCEIESTQSSPVIRTPLGGTFLSDMEPGERLNRKWAGMDLSQVELGELYSIFPGSLTNDIELGILSRNHLGILIAEPITAGLSSNCPGYFIDDPVITSNAEYRFKLLVTPTHQYRSQIVTVEATNSQGFPLMGRYQLEIAQTVIIPYEPTDIDLRSVSFTVMPSQLETGNNPCRLNYLYPDGSREYLDFEIFKEETRRTTVERLFRSYDGGYDGDRFNPAYVYAPAKYPCFMVPDGKIDTVIKTTNYTSIPLARYTGLQAVNIEAENAKILVSFNKGLTWRALINSTWETVAIDNIGEYGMDAATVNSIVFARWQEIFTPTSLDFAIYLDKNYLPPLVATVYKLGTLTISGDTISGNAGTQYYCQAMYTSCGKDSGKWYFESTTKMFYAPQPGVFTLNASLYNLPGYYGWWAGQSRLILNGSFIGGAPTGTITPTTVGISLNFDDKIMTLVSYSTGVRVSGAISPGQTLHPGAGLTSNNTNQYTTFNLRGGVNADFEGRLPLGYLPWITPYLKSINVQITPRLKTGYAFIM